MGSLRSLYSERDRIDISTFHVFVGTSIKKPCILRRSQLNWYAKAYIIEVPEKYRRYFELDIETALRDFAGIKASVGG